MTFPVLSANTPAATAVLLTRSLRFRSSASAYLNRTFTTPTSATIWTWSAWVKRGAITGTYRLFGASTTTYLTFNSSDQLNLTLNGTSAATSTAVFRDPSSWYHIVYQQNGSAQTIYVNNVSVATGTTAASIFNTAISHQIGAANTSNYFDGYLTEINFIDGQAKTPASFGSTNSTTGVWQPITYTGTYGTNGFYLPFTNTTSTSTLVSDSSGNGNNWTPNNISLTAGSTYDSMTDVPTLTSATAANYAVLNPLNAPISGFSISNGNLSVSSSSTSWNSALASIGMSSGKWYCEATVIAVGTNDVFAGGLTTTYQGLSYPGSTATSYGYIGSVGNKYNNATGTAYGATYTANDVIGVAFDADAGTLTFYKNNASQGTAFTGLTNGPYYFIFSGVENSNIAVNFGQRPFIYTPPTGFIRLNTYNLPASTVQNGANYMAATLYTGTGASLTVANTVGSASFQPDWVWIKSRSAATDHKLTDVVRGVTKGLISDTTGAETTDTNGLTAFGSTGFTVGTDTNYNNSSATYVAWNWKAGGTAVSNTNGSITSSVSANTTSGFSVATYTGTGVAGTIGHGLGVAPSMIIVKSRSAIGDWPVYHTSLGNGSNVLLNTTAASASSATIWNATSPTSSVFSVGINTTSNTVTVTYVAYCFTAIKGFSSFGKYTGNGSTDGPFVYTGFRPRYVMVKRTDSTSDWYIWDTSRDTYNVQAATLLADTAGAETSATSIDGLSNGFKCRSATVVNVSAGTYIYMAFAENPFQNALAR
jgi:hypothetical protein